MRLALPAFLILSVLARPSFGWLSNPDAGYAGEFLTAFSGGSRGLGMGLAQAALDGQACALYVNPAGIASLWWQEMSVTMAPLFAEGQFLSFSYGYPFDDVNSMGISIVRLTSGEAEKTNELGEITGSFSEQETALLAGYGRKFPGNLHAGVSAKFITQEIASSSEKAATMDLGLVYYAADNHHWALSLANVLPSGLGPDDMPFVPRLGFWHGLLPALSLTADMQLTGFFQSANPVTRWFGGVEYSWPEWARWRCGVNQKQASLGFGISTRQIDFDYALLYHPLDFIHSFTLTIRYGFTVTEAERNVQRDWDALAKEKEEYRIKKEKDEKRIRFEMERLARASKLSVKFLEARREFDEKRYGASQQILELILKEDAGHEEARQLLAEIHARMNTETIVRRTKEIRSNYSQGKFEAAIENVNYILDIQPGNSEVRVYGYLSRAQLFVRDKKFMEAKGELIEVLKIAPENAEATRLIKRIQTVLDISAP